SRSREERFRLNSLPGRLSGSGWSGSDAAQDRRYPLVTVQAMVMGPAICYLSSVGSRPRLRSAFMRILLIATAALGFVSNTHAADEELAEKARHVFDTYCHRCHGKDGAVEGGMNYVTDLAKLVARKKVVPGNP